MSSSSSLSSSVSKPDRQKNNNNHQHQIEKWSVKSEQQKDNILSSSGDESLSSAGRWALERAGSVLASREIAIKSIIWACDSIERLPIRLTLENVGVFTILLALLLPRVITYTLTYPIFRLVFGTLYPAYASYKAVRTKNVKEYVKWMMYWIVFALFTCAETFTDVFFSFWFPFYYEIKIILVLWLLSPATKGSSILYRRFVHPALCRREAEIDEALARATEQGYSAVLQLGTKGVNYATTVLMQTAIKGGGGLVQQLRKSYSLSDLTGEKDEVSRSISVDERTTDQVDYIDVEPRRREKSGRRGYSPRRTQSSSNRVDMYFQKVDLEVDLELDARQQTRQSRLTREPPISGVVLPTLTNVKSSEDISSGYSSGEALQTRKSPSNNEAPLVRTASVGARNRTKVTRSSSKKLPEVDESQIEENVISSIKNLPVENILSHLTGEQVIEFLALVSQHSQEQSRDSNLALDKNYSDDDDDDEDSSTLKADPPNVVAIEKNNLNNALSTNHDEVKEIKQEQESGNDVKIVLDKDEAKNLLDNNQDSKELQALDIQTTDSLIARHEMEPSPERLTDQINLSRSSSDCSERAGKYNKKPAPKAPLEMLAAQSSATQDSVEDEDDSIELEPVKASLVIKLGTVKSTDSEVTMFTDAKSRKKSNAKGTLARKSFSKFLTIPKNIFHNTFHKEREEENQKGDEHEEKEKEAIKEKKEEEEGDKQDKKKDCFDKENEEEIVVKTGSDVAGENQKEDTGQVESTDTVVPVNLEKTTDV